MIIFKILQNEEKIKIMYELIKINPELKTIDCINMIYGEKQNIKLPQFKTNPIKNVYYGIPVKKINKNKIAKIWLQTALLCCFITFNYLVISIITNFLLR